MDRFKSFTKDEIEPLIAAPFERHVRRYPQRLAVKTQHGSLTYSALNQAAHRLARGILAPCGNGTEAVALFFESGADLCVPQ